jgi:transposase
LRLVTSRFQRKKSLKPNRKNVEENPKKNKKSGWLNKLKKSESYTFRKENGVQLDAPLDQLRSGVPQEPEWGIKNSEGKNVFWLVYKGHLAVSTTSQYILQTLFFSGILNDGKAAIPLLKGFRSTYLFLFCVTK